MQRAVLRSRGSQQHVVDPQIGDRQHDIGLCRNLRVGGNERGSAIDFEFVASGTRSSPRPASTKYRNVPSLAALGWKLSCPWPV